MKLFLEYEKEEDENNDVKTGGGPDPNIANLAGAAAGAATGNPSDLAGLAAGAAGADPNTAKLAGAAAGAATGNPSDLTGLAASAAGADPDTAKLAGAAAGAAAGNPGDLAGLAADAAGGDIPEVPGAPEVPSVPEVPSAEDIAIDKAGAELQGLADGDDPTKALGIAAGAAGIDAGGLAGAAGLGDANGFLPPKDGVRSTEPGEIMKVWSNKVGKQIECSKFVHERVKKLIQTVYRNTLQELEEDGSKILKEALEETRLKFRTKINNERIDALKNLLDALKPYLSLEDDKLRTNGIKQYVHAVGDLYYYLINEDTSSDYSNSVKKSKAYIDDIKEEDELKAVVTKMAKKYDDFIEALNLKFTVPPTTQTDKEGTIIEDIMRNPFETKTGGNKKSRNKTKKRRIKRKNRTR
jgi:hypothetical protein